MRFVMTGHKGLIGSSLLERLASQRHESVLNVDIRDGKNILSMLDYPLEQPADCLFHLASLCKINKCIENPLACFENNVLGTQKVLEFCRKNKIPKIVFTSSSRVLSPEKNPYTAAKIYGEELVKGYGQSYGMEYVIIRPSTVYGPFNDKTKRLMDVFILNALQGKELEIFGGKEKTLDFTYVEDFVDGLTLAMGEKNKEFDLSYGRGIHVDYVADMIISLAGGGAKKFSKPEIAQPQKVNLDISKIKNIGYSPKINIEEGIKKTFNWYKANLKEILESRQ
jgi:nucleoside-diphosphate-sugar epimerase